MLTGNCSVSLAPCKTEDRNALARLFHKLEDIPIEAFTEGIDWRWESFGELADALDPTLAINVAAMVGHSTLRFAVMGPESQEREATDEEVQAMCALLLQSLEGGAIGLSTDRLIQHVGDGGRPIPSRMASDEELFALCEAMRDRGTGLLQSGPATNVPDTPAYVRDVLRPIALNTGMTVLLSGTVQERGAPDRWREIHDLIAEGQRDGARIFTQATPCRIDGRFSLAHTLQFNEMPTWRHVLSLPLDERKAAFRDPEVRDRLQFEAVEDTRPIFFSRRWDTIFVLEIESEKNQHLIGQNVLEASQRDGKRVVDWVLDLVLEEDLQCAFVAIGRANGDDDAVVAQLVSPQAIVGSSDAVAHVMQM
ncbi:MAG TPA: hypothetical protein PLV68_00430, partial [Ilumatobacteraceae bacterium]|nr:hypothetical protein [Ilumatobacteraceae bacterium]